MFLVFDSKANEEFFYDIYSKYNKLLYKYSNDILHNHHDVEDALQTAWFRISKHINRLINFDKQKCINFLITVVINVSKDIAKAKNTEVIDETVSINTDKKYALDYNGFGSTDIKEAIMRLPDKHRDVFVLKYVYGFSYKEIGTLLDISETNAGSIALRSKNMIKGFLTEGDGK